MRGRSSTEEVAPATDEALLTPRSRSPRLHAGGAVVDAQEQNEMLTPTQLVESRWLLLLFVETTLLLVFQLAVGYYSNSLTLIADSAHSCADVVGYGINYLTERLKVSAAAQAGTYWNAETASSLATRLDLFGCAVSTVLLCSATWFATQEALERLMPSHHDDHETTHRRKSTPADDGDGSDFWGIGMALLSFAIVSTAANAGTYVLYYRWKSLAEANADIATANAADLAPPLPYSPALAPDEEKAVPPVRGVQPVPEVPPLPGMDESIELAPLRSASSMSGRPQRSGRSRGSGALNLSASFAGDCAEACCTPGADASSSSGAANDNQSRRKPSWSASLHMLFHPGCSGDHGDPNGEASTDADGMLAIDGREAKNIGNLNVSSAMLHLAADVLRGITILIAAVLIEVGVARDPGKADAICALFVAFFVAVGSVELLRRVGTALWRVRSQVIPSLGR